MASQRGEQLARFGISRVRVVDDQDQRPPLGDRAQQPEGRLDRSQPVQVHRLQVLEGRHRRDQPDQGAAGAAQLHRRPDRRPRVGGQRVGHRTVGKAADRRRAPGHHRGAEFPGAVGERLEQPGLADPCRTADHGDAQPGLGARGDLFPEQLQFRLPADERPGDSGSNHGVDAKPLHPPQWPMGTSSIEE